MRDTISLVMGLVLIGCATVQTEPDKFVLPAGKHFFGEVLVRADGFLGGKFMYEPTDLEAARSFASSYVVTPEDVRVDAAGCVDLVCRIGYLANFAVFARGDRYEVVLLHGPIRRETAWEEGPLITPAQVRQFAARHGDRKRLVHTFGLLRRLSYEDAVEIVGKNRIRMRWVREGLITFTMYGRAHEVACALDVLAPWMEEQEK